MENRLRRTITSTDEAALRAGPRGVAGVNRHDRHARQSRLVLKEEAELMETPSVVCSPLGLANRDPRADALEVFQGEAASGVFGLRNQTLGDLMVDVASEALLFAAAFTKQPFGRFGSPGLELGPQFCVSAAQAVDVPARVDIPIGIGGDIDDAQIDTEKPFDLIDVGVGEYTVLQQIECAVLEDQVGLASDASQLLLPVLPTDKRHNLAAPQRQNRDAIKALEGQEAIVEHDGAIGPEAMSFAAVASEALNNLADCADGHLGGEAETLPDGPIAGMVQTNLRSRLEFMGYARDIVGGLIEGFHRIAEHLLLVVGWQQFDFDCQVHIGSIGYRRNLSIEKLLKFSPEGEGI